MSDRLHELAALAGEALAGWQRCHETKVDYTKETATRIAKLRVRLSRLERAIGEDAAFRASLTPEELALIRERRQTRR